MNAGEQRAQPWYRKGSLYQIYPLSFADSNGDGYGDLKGIVQHLDYLNGGDEALGVAAIWLSPIYRSPMKDFGYDISDFCAIDPVFGTMDDFDELVKGIHRRGMKLLLDFVPNHTSSEHAWFQEARQSRASSKRDWYIWADPKADGSPPNNWQSLFGGSAWTLDEVTGQYYLHTFLASQPDLNWRNPAVRQEMTAILRFWLARGVDGFRTDSVYYLIKDEKLRDDPPNPNFRPGIDDPSTALLRTYSSGQDQIFELLDEFCTTIGGDGGSLLLTESYIGIDQMKRMYRACVAHPIHSPFNFNLISLPWGAESFGDWIDAYEESLGPDDLPNYVLGNHDRPRLASRLGPERARLLAVLQCTLRGLPVIYYGDELGMQNSVVSLQSEQDPWGINVPGNSRDVARGPMVWTTEQYGGFSEVEPWQPFAPQSHRLAVDVESRDPESFLALYRRLIHLKSVLPALAEGKYRRIKTDNVDCYAFMRYLKGKAALIILNYAATGRSVSVEGNHYGQMLLSTHNVDGGERATQIGRVRLGGYEGRIYELEVRA